ncbi:MAG: hypothetical protein IJL66_01185 [Lachnospiraceae bacterium]|nr:hypothetical protein [Lachnospiraceae bacterium]
MSAEYRKELRLRAEHVDCFRRLRLSVLMRLFQECCIAHTEELGMGREKTLDRGLLWVVNTETVVISRLPVYDESVTLVCRPGRTMHLFFPRQMEVLDETGRVLIRVGALWSLIDRETRRIADPAEHGVFIEGDLRPDDVMPALSLPHRELSGRAELSADYSRVDINGHMNNAVYLDALTDLIEPERIGQIQRADLVFVKELPLGSRTELSYGEEDGVFLAHCAEFSARLTFAPEMS